MLALLCAACGAGGGDGAPVRPSLLLVSLDTVRADRTSLLGHPVPTTPNLDALARDGASFTRAYAMTSTTGPSHGTLFTGRYAPTHGVARNGMPLPGTATTLAEHLAARGYRTAGFVGSFVLSRRFGFGQGFATWDEAFEGATSSLPMERWEGRAVPGGAFDRSAAETTRRALAWLRRHGRDGPFFLFVHYFDAHEPYTPAAEDRARLDAAVPDPIDPFRPYDAEIAGVDRWLGALLAGLGEVGLAGETLVVVTSDHGQGLADHGDPYHSVNLYEESVRAVLVLRGPGVAPGLVSDVPVEAVDVLPTILDLLRPGSHAGLALPGRSLAAHLRGAETPSADRPVFLYRQRYPRPTVVRDVPVVGSQYGVRVGPWKYVEGDRDGRRELYDLSRDPGERRDLAGSEPERAAAMRERLRAWRAEHPPPEAAAPRLSEEDRARLRALGYVE